MSYNPNLNDPRVLRRVKRVLTWALSHIPAHKHRELSQATIDKYFGKHSNPLSQWLRKKLLITVFDYYNPETKTAKSYRLNASAANNLKAQVFPSVKMMDVVADELMEKHHTELSTKLFTYNTVSDRRNHVLQQVRKPYRRHLFKRINLCYEYDIECAMPTLLHEYAITQGFTDTTEAIMALKEYKKDFRQHIAEDTGLEVGVVKRIINALFYGGKLSCYPENELWYEIGQDYKVLNALKQHPYLRQLRADISRLWKFYGKITPRKTRKDIKTGKDRLVAFNGSAKSSIYLALEYKIMGVVIDYLKDTSNPVFLEHDGFTSEYEVDVSELCRVIYEKTKMHVKFSYEYVGCSSRYAQ